MASIPSDASHPLRLATRGSPLALWQARAAATALERARPGAATELVEVRSSGDRDRETALTGFGQQGIFTVEVDRAVLEERAGSGVHSLKDLTTTLPEGIALAAVLPRGPVEDVLVARAAGGTLETLPEGARVATGSRRRRALVSRARGDLRFVELRGNVETRLARLDAGEAEALVLARAGLERLGLGGRVSQVLDAERFLPAVGQGIVALTCRVDDDATRAWLAEVNHLESWHAALAERALLAGLHGGCNVPVGVRTRLDGDELVLRAEVLATDGTRTVAGERRGPRSEAPALGADLAAELVAEGAGELVREARR